MNVLPTSNLDYAWDRAETAETLRAKLAGGPSPEWLRTAAWLMREAWTDEVWQFLTLRQVAGASARTWASADGKSSFEGQLIGYHAVKMMGRWQGGA